MSPKEKRQAYERSARELEALLAGETDTVLKMASINGVLKSNLTYFYWVGFYRVSGEQRLSVGPYQGTLGCLHIDFARGVCGKAAREKKTQIVPDTHALKEGSEHIACDPNSRSEIVLPVFDPQGALIAVFDVDSSEPGSFDEIDGEQLERILKKHFSA